MAKKKEKVTENSNKEADVKAFVEENYGKTLSSEDIEKSKKALKETTKKHYDDNPELKEARKKQVSDYKKYKADKIANGPKKKTAKKEEEPIVTVEPVTEVEEKKIEVLEEPKPEVIEEKPVTKPVEEKPKSKPKDSLSAYGSYGMGLMYG